MIQNLKLNGALAAVCLFLVGFSASPSYAEPDFSEVQCPKDLTVLASRLLDVELAGKRLAAPNENCLDQKKFPIFIVQPYMWEEAQSEPKVETAGAKPYNIEKVTDKKNGAFEVEFTWTVRRLDRDVKLKDTFAFQRYKGATQRTLGCADMLFSPTHVVVRADCR